MIATRCKLVLKIAMASALLSCGVGVLAATHKQPVTHKHTATSMHASAGAAEVSGLSKFSPAQQQQLGKYMDSSIHEYLMSNPQVIVQAVQQYEMQQHAKMMNKSLSVIAENVQALVADPISPSIGPKNAPVTFVEFSDYQCSICHAMYPRIKQLIKNNPNVRFVFKEFPIFGPASIYAAKAAIAATRQGKFEALHNALFSSSKMEGKLTKQDVLDMAKQVGINIVKLQKDMKNPAVAREISDNYKLAGPKLKLQGTPAFLIIPTPPAKKLTESQLVSRIGFVPGGAALSQLQGMIDAAAK